MSPAGRKEPAADETLTDAGQSRLRSVPDLVAPQLFVALECSRAEAGSSRHSLVGIDRVLLGRGLERSAERSFEGAQTLTVRVPDRRMSLLHARLLRDGEAFVAEDAGSRNGTRLNGAPLCGSVRLVDGDILEAGHTLLSYRSAIALPPRTPADVESSNLEPGGLLLTVDPSLAQRLGMLERVARSKTPVLLLGETGTGKEFLARAIHRISERAGAFVAVNCGALPAALVEAQLFGHVRGAFSGAVGDSPGLIRSADRGTLLLDEVGDLPEPAQAALLRALQEHEVVPLGEVRPAKVDLRVLAATNRPLEALVEREAFRSDLFARLASYTFSIPAVRERREDIGLLIASIAKRRTMRFTPSAGRALLRYPWPRNVRELYGVLDVAATLADGDPIDLVHLPPAVERAAAPRHSEPQEVLRDPLRERLVVSLALHKGNVSEVARELGKARRQVQRWMARYCLDARAFR